MGLSQIALARACNLGDNLIYRYEKGLNDPTTESLKAIADKLGVSSDYLLGLTNDPRGHNGDSDLSEDERDVIEVLRREGWRGVIHLGADRLAR
jgi:transcriptional regulator with XRE-family HTH domain